MNTAYELVAKDVHPHITAKVDISQYVKKDNWNPRYTSDGRKKATASDPVRDPSMVIAIADYLGTHGKATKYKLRNRMGWILGCTTGLRISDLLGLKIGDVLNPDGSFVNYLSIREKKTRKHNDPRLGRNAQEAISDYLASLNSYTLDDYLIMSERKGKMDETQFYRILVKAADAVGFKGSMGTHTMRKTYGYNAIHNNPNDAKALIHLQGMFNHSSPSVTLAYCGITRDEEDKYYDQMDSMFD